MLFFQFTANSIRQNKMSCLSFNSSIYWNILFVTIKARKKTLQNKIQRIKICSIIKMIVAKCHQLHLFYSVKQLEIFTPI